MSSAYNVCFLYLSDVKHIISLRIHAVSIVTLIDAFTAFNPIWTHHEHFSSPNPYIGSWDTRHAKSGLHVVSRDVNPTSILASHYICYIPGYKCVLIKLVWMITSSREYSYDLWFKREFYPKDRARPRTSRFSQSLPIVKRCCENKYNSRNHS